MEHDCNPSTGELRQQDCHEFEANLWATRWGQNHPELHSETMFFFKKKAHTHKITKQQQQKTSQICSVTVFACNLLHTCTFKSCLLFVSATPLLPKNLALVQRQPDRKPHDCALRVQQVSGSEIAYLLIKLMHSALLHLKNSLWLIQDMWLRSLR